MIRDITLIIKGVNKQISLKEVDETTTGNDLLAHLANAMDSPTNLSSILIRKLTNRQLLPNQTLGNLGVEDGEVLIADLATKTQTQEHQPATLAREDVNTPEIAAEVSNLEKSSVAVAGRDIIFQGDTEFQKEILKEIQRFREVIDKVSSHDTFQITKQFENLIEEYAWPDFETRMEFEGLIIQSADLAEEIIKLFLEQESLVLQQYDIEILEDREAAIAAFWDYVSRQREAGLGSLFFEEWALFACGKFLGFAPCPTTLQRFPFDLNRLLELLPSLAPMIWAFLCEQEQLIRDQLFRLRQMGLGVLVKSIQFYFQDVHEVEGTLDVKLVAQLLSTSLSPISDTPLIQENMKLVFEKLSSQDWEKLNLIDYFNDRNLSIMNKELALRAQVREVWLSLSQYWINEHLEIEAAIEITELEEFLLQMRSSLDFILDDYPISEEIPERLKVAIKRNPMLLKRNITAFRKKHLLCKKWQLQLQNDMRKIRRTVFISSGVQDISRELEELTNFLNEDSENLFKDEDYLTT